LATAFPTPASTLGTPSTKPPVSII
jgi:hypothetical protein